MSDPKPTRLDQALDRLADGDKVSAGILFAKHLHDAFKTSAEQPATRRLYVGNLDYEATDADLKDLFRQCGEVESVEICRSPSGRSKGFGFAVYQKVEAAELAAAKLNGIQWRGRKIQVNGAKASKGNE